MDVWNLSNSNRSDSFNRNKISVEEVQIELAAWTLQGRDKQIFRELWLAQNQFKKAQRGVLTELSGTLSDIADDIKKNDKIGPALNEHIVNMAKFQSGTSDEVLGSILSLLYIDCELYDEFFAICDAILEFDDEDAQRMSGNTIIEDSILRLMERISDNPNQSSEVVDKCLQLLHKRAKLLNFDPILDLKGSDKFYQTSDLATSISSRHRIFSAQTLNTWIQETYGLAHKFLGLQEDKISMMRTEGCPLIHDASITLWKTKHKKQPNVISYGALKKLEFILHCSNKFGFRDDDYGYWITKICTDKLWSSLFEMDLYLRLRKIGADVEICPTVKDSQITSFKIGDCHIGLYSSHDPVTSPYGDMTRAWKTGRNLTREIIKQYQSERSETGFMIMIIEDPFDFSDDLDFCDSLKSIMEEKLQLKGVYFIQESDNTYYGTSLKNPASKTMMREISQTIDDALTFKLE